MKRLFELLYPYFITYGFAYLIGSFIAASFDPADWPIDLRALMPALGLIFGYMLWININSEDGTI